MKNKNLLIAAAIAALMPPALTAAPLGTAFTYQGQLHDNGAPAAGFYDLRFTLHDAAGGGASSAPVLYEDVEVAGGLFTVPLDFGSGQFTGQARWLEIQVRPGDSVAAFTPLTPRQALTAAPYAQFALNGNAGPQGPSGPAGGPGPAGPAGPQGQAGPQGIPGTMGPSNIVGSAFVAGSMAYPTSTMQFLAPPVTVTITAPGQRVYVSATRALGGYAAAINLDLGIAYRNASTPAAVPTAIALTIDGLQVPANTRIPMSITGIISNLPVGTYQVGMAGKDGGHGLWTNSEWGYTSALVFTHP